MVETLRSARVYFWPIITANILAMAVGVGGDVRHMALFSLVLSALASFGFLVNDLSDRRIDRVNQAGHFERASDAAVVLGRVTATIFLIGAVALAWRLGTVELSLTAGIAAALAVYSSVLRRAALVANLATGVLATAPLWAPLVITPPRVSAWQWWLVSAAGGMIVAREILMDVRDRVGDEAGGRITLATWLGARPSVQMAKITTLTAIAPLAVAVTIGIARLGPWLALAAVIVAAVFLFLVLGPIARVQAAHSDSRATIQHYVLRSRLAMACFPAIALLLAQSP